MKKIFFIASVLTLFSFNAIYAADFKVGIGIGGDIGFISTAFNTTIPEPEKSQIEELLKDTKMNRGGFCFFLDLTYFEISMGGKYYNILIKQNGADLKETQSYFNLGVIGKIPFDLNSRLSLFPFIGLDFQALTKFKDSIGSYSETVTRSELSDYDIDREYFDRTVFNFGLGMDVYIVRGLFFRGSFNYGINFHTRQQKDLIDVINDMGYKMFVLNHGPSVKFAMGYKF